MLVAWGWNGMQSHQMPRAPKVLAEFSKDPDRLLVAIDPRKSETAAIADIHLPVRPGSRFPADENHDRHHPGRGLGSKGLYQ